MHILHFTYNTSGGAGKVAKQLHELLRKHGYDSTLINTRENDPGAGILTIPSLDSPARRMLNSIRYWLFRLRVRLSYPKKPAYSFHFNYNYFRLSSRELINAIPVKPDIIILHWIADFILPHHIKALQDHFKCPIIWRYNDLAPVTGGCHYPGNCDRYKTGCGHCPALGSEKENDWSRRHWLQKKTAFESIPVTIINSTTNTEAAFKVSPLFRGKRQEFIRNSLNQDFFYPEDSRRAKDQLGIPEGKKIIFWGATHITETRKGFSLFLKSLQLLSGDRPMSDYLVIIAGNKPASFNPAIPVDHQYVGLLPVDELVDWYNASDLVVVSSLEDGGPMMIVESLMCGTPVVAFATGLGAEIVHTGENGYRAARADVKDLTKGISYVLNLQPAEYQSLRLRCHQGAAGLYGEEAEIQAYKKLFSELS